MNPRSESELTLVVRVVRTGGFAGLRREWTAEPAADETSEWIPLIDDCPWDDTAPDDAEPDAPLQGAGGTPRKKGADRFVWLISARCDPEPERSARLGDAEVTGPWRTLVDAVRSFDAA